MPLATYLGLVRRSVRRQDDIPGDNQITRDGSLGTLASLALGSLLEFVVGIRGDASGNGANNDGDQRLNKREQDKHNVPHSLECSGRPAAAREGVDAFAPAGIRSRGEKPCSLKNPHRREQVPWGVLPAAVCSDGTVEERVTPEPLPRADDRGNCPASSPP